MRHVELQTLCLQEQPSRKRHTCVRVTGCSKAADVLTKHLSGPCLEKCMAAMECRWEPAGAGSIEVIRRWIVSMQLYVDVVSNSFTRPSGGL